MSWFTEIAGKAEDLLNRVDQSAATALQKQNKTSAYNPDSPYHSPSYNQANASSTPFVSPMKPSASMSSLSSERKSSFSAGALTPKKKAESDDEKLMLFLNSDEPVPCSKPVVSSAMKMDERVLKEAAVIKEELCKSESTTIDFMAPRVMDFVSKAEAKHVDSVNSVPAAAPSGVSVIPTVSSTASDKDINAAQKRADHAEAEMKRMSRKLDHWNSQISGNDKVARELREREKDMIAAMDAKDSQLAILKVRLQEADQELSSRSHIIEVLKSENDRIVRDHAESAASQNKTIELLQEQLQETIHELKKTKDLFMQTQNDHMEKMHSMEEEQRHLAESYSTLQKKWNELNEKFKDITTQLKHSQGNLDVLQEEYTDYKQKAQRILQSKEKLICSLKEGHLEVDSIEKKEAASFLLTAEFEGLKQEKDLLKDELRRANEMMEAYRGEIQALEKMSQNELVASQEKSSALKEQLEGEKVQREEAQLFNQQLKEEIQSLQADLIRTKGTYQSRIQDREIEIEKLRRQLTAKALSTVSQDELESRLHALTENLIQKQTLVEALSTEKNSLLLQRERLEQHLREAQNYGMQQHTFVGINNNEQEGKSKAVFLDNPFDSALTRRAKRVYSTIDSISIRLGVFFKRYPIARVFIIIYMLLLHFWVMIVLLTYQPEVHNITYEDAKNK